MTSRASLGTVSVWFEEQVGMCEENGKLFLFFMNLGKKYTSYAWKDYGMCLLIHC